MFIKTILYFIKEVIIMATPKHSGFEAPIYGTVLPKGMKLKKNADGTISAVPATQRKKKKKKDVK